MQTAGVHSQVNVFPAHTHTHTHTQGVPLGSWQSLHTSGASCAHTSPTSSISSLSLLAAFCSSSDAHTATKAYTYKQGDPPLSSCDTSKHRHTHTNTHTHTLSLSKPPLHLPGINVISAPSPLYSPNEGHVLIKPWEWMGLVSLLSRPISSFLPSAIHFFFDLLPCSLTVIMLGLPPSLRFPPLIVSSENVFSIWIFFF